MSRLPSDAGNEDGATSGVVACVHAALCAGCPLIDRPYGEQLGLKHARVVAALARHPALERVPAEPVVPAEPATGYRTRAKLMVAPGPRIGLYARTGAHLVVDIPECRVLSPALGEVAASLRRLLAAPPVEAGAALVPYDGANGGALAALDLREARDGDEAAVLVTLVLVGPGDRFGDALVAAAKAVRAGSARVAGVAVNFREPDAPQVLGAETAVLDGASAAPDRVGGAFQLATYGSFVQAHRGQAAAIHALLARELGENGSLAGKRVLDLYGGSGAIGLSLAAAGAEVAIVESFAPAAEGARRAAADQGLAKVRVVVGDAAEVAAALVGERERFDAVVANPPRRGLAPEVRAAIARLDAPVVAYVSCDPDTLARDLDDLARFGWLPSRVRPFDMIPLTDEVESVAILHRGAPPLPRVLYADDDVLVVEKPPHEPTTPQGEHASSLLDRARRLPGAAEAVPIHRLDIGTSGLLLLARRPAVVAPWSRALAAESGRKIYLAAVKGITPSKGAVTRALREEGRMLAARTRYRRLAFVSGHSLLRVLPDEGRTHQIRRHLAGIGHPVLGDERHGHAPTNRYFAEKHGLDRTFLHCLRIEIDHPRTGERLVLESPIAGDLRGVLERAASASMLRKLERHSSLGPSSTARDEATSGRDEATSGRDEATGGRDEATGGRDDEAGGREDETGS